MIDYKIGFACKIYEHNTFGTVKEYNQYLKSLNTRSTTVSWMKRCSSQITAFDRIHEIATHNLDVTLKALQYVKKLNPINHFMRVSSDLLPLYSHSPHKQI